MIKIINEVDFSRLENDDFGEDWIEHISKECIKGATLLSKEEYEKYKDNISKIDAWWWLRSPGEYYDSACDVGDADECGDVHENALVFDTDESIRPALILDTQSSNLGVGDKFEFGKHMFTTISGDLAICDDIIGKGCFREDDESEDANVYEKSDIKKYIDNWFNKAYREYEG